jgi:hypothetical protein
MLEKMVTRLENFRSIGQNGMINTGMILEISGTKKEIEKIYFYVVRFGQPCNATTAPEENYIHDELITINSLSIIILKSINHDAE